ncbi:hypothetical protein SLS60_007245 [Paraconiothyrium brasiliense]|uniref:Uncharacterized protein n=1 Tax=Paraconiothyrium brasiliense TaxID=300254 RepID=A0ABR3R918_9PLEO
MNIRVSEEYFSQYRAQSAKLSDGSGYAAQLGVYHELHCLKKIKHWIHRSHYHTNVSQAVLDEEEEHVEHCLEWLRLGVMCRADVTLSALQWDSPTGSRLETEYPIPRKCVNFERLKKWSEERAIDVTETGIIDRPYS